MGPILGMSFSAVVKDRAMFQKSMRNELYGFFFTFLAGAICGVFAGIFMDPEDERAAAGFNTQIQQRGTAVGVIWGGLTAIPSGFALGYAVSNYAITAIVGVAIAAALLPPIVNSGLCCSAAFIFYVRNEWVYDEDVETWLFVGLLPLPFSYVYVCFFLCVRVSFPIK